MASNHTPNYNLNQWQATDRVIRTEFNEDNAKIDTALAAKAELSALTALAGRTAALGAGQLRLHTGTYQGTGGSTMSIEFPFPPKIIWIQKINQWDEHMLICGTLHIHHQVGGAYGDKLPWCTDAGTDLKYSGNTMTLDSSGYVSMTDVQKAMYTMNRKSYKYLYLEIG